MTKKAAKKAAKKKPGKSSAKQAAATSLALHDIKDALAEIKNLLQQLLRQQGQPPRFTPCPPYQPITNSPPTPLPWKRDEVPLETKGLPPGLMFNGAHMDAKALSKAEY